MHYHGAFIVFYCGIVNLQSAYCLVDADYSNRRQSTGTYVKQRPKQFRGVLYVNISC